MRGIYTGLSRRHCNQCINTQMFSNMQNSTALLYAFWPASYVKNHDVFAILLRPQRVVASTGQSCSRLKMGCNGVQSVEHYYFHGPTSLPIPQMQCDQACTSFLWECRKRNRLTETTAALVESRISQDLDMSSIITLKYMSLLYGLQCWLQRPLAQEELHSFCCFRLRTLPEWRTSVS